MEQYLTVSQAADKLGVNPQTLRRWDSAGKFTSLRHPMNNYRVYTNHQVELLMRELAREENIGPEHFSTGQALSSPFFETQLGKLFNVGAVDFLKNLPEGSVDLIFADPPYNIKKAEWDTFESQKKYIDWSMHWIEEASRVLQPEGSLYICGFSEILADIKWAASGLFRGCKWLVWYYRNKGNLGNDWGRSHESLLHFRKSKKFIFNLDEVRVPYNAHTLKYPTHPQAQSSQYSNGKKQYIWTPHPDGAKPKDVFELPTLSNSSWEKTIHPTQKPLELMKKVILASSKEDSLIIDPFGGSGTTYAVAEAFDRRWMGSELDSDYCKIIKDRITDRDYIARILSGKDETEAIKRRGKLRG